MAETWIDRYHLQERLSRRGTGEVWRAYDDVLERPVVVKLLYDDLGDSLDLERFLREARATARLAHPNVVATHNIGEWDGRPYLVLEYLTGRTLADELDERGPLPIDDVRELGAQAAAGLEAVHQAGIVHRDLKPANLMLTVDGTLKLIDFGLAWLSSEAGTRLTPADTALGTVSYLAPEVASGRSADERSDLYSLGCVLYELACGRPPFEGSMAAVVLGQVQDEPAPPSSLRTDLPADLEALILQLLAKDPERRPASAEEVRQRLLGVGGIGRLPALEAFPSPRKEIAVRRPALALVGGLLVAGIVGVLVWWALPSLGDGMQVADQSRPRGPAVQQARPNATDFAPAVEPSGGHPRVSEASVTGEAKVTAAVTKREAKQPTQAAKQARKAAKREAKQEAKQVKRAAQQAKRQANQANQAK